MEEFEITVTFKVRAESESEASVALQEELEEVLLGDQSALVSFTIQP